MLFNSAEFLLFCALFYALWPLARRNAQVRWGFITVASFFFYGWWDWRFVFLLAGSGIVDYLAALAMRRWHGQRRVFLALSLLANLGSLGIFKYLDFAVDNLNAAGATLTAPGLILPVGISFYTFQSMSYTIDVYRGRLEPTRNLLHFFAYLAMFGQLVAGPIVRAREMIPQLERGDGASEEDRWVGLGYVVHGFFKKVVIADNLAPFVDEAFGNPVHEPLPVYWWIASVLFAFQIYCDFSGYSLIARGLARWMGYRFPTNFNHPYVATSFRDFWSRWHISLSSWFRDYVYVPLGGSRQGQARGHLNMWITMIVSGLWHGASWSFVFWGGLHAAYLSAERLTNWPTHLRRIPAGRHIAAVLVFCLALVGWVFFRATTLAQAFEILATMGRLPWAVAEAAAAQSLAPLAGVSRFSLTCLTVAAVLVAREVSVHFGLGGSRLGEGRWVRWGRPAVLAAMIAACVFLRGPGQVFIYFQF